MTRAYTRRTPSRQPIDIGRIREAVSGPGIDPRRWVVAALVSSDDDAVFVHDDGVWIECEIKSTGEPLSARWTLGIDPQTGRGVWIPPPRPGAEIAVIIDGGNPLNAIGVPGFYASDLAAHPGFQIPAAILAEPDAVHVIGADQRVILTTTKDILAKSDTKVQIQAPAVEIGNGALLANARKTDPVRVTIPIGGVSVTGPPGGPYANTVPIVIDGTITAGSTVVKSA